MKALLQVRDEVATVKFDFTIKVSINSSLMHLTALPTKIDANINEVF